MLKRGKHLSRSTLLAICICLVTLLAFFSLSYLDLKSISVIQRSSADLSKDDTAVTLLRKSNESLDKAENHYRIYLNSSDTTYRWLFLSDIVEAINDLDAIRSLDTGFTKKILQNVNNKISYYNAIEGLKKVADSIIHQPEANQRGDTLTQSQSTKLRNLQTSFLERYITNATDTVRIVPIRRKGFIEKLSRLFSNEDSLPVKREYVKGRRSGRKVAGSHQSESDTVTGNLANHILAQYQNTVNHQLYIQNELRNKERGLAETNLSIVSDINDKIKDLIQKTTIENRTEKAEAISKIDGAGSSIRKIRTVSLIVIVILIGLLIYNIYRTNKYEEAIVSARISAEKVSQLKSRFLSNISHEIRSPLGGIMGFTEQILHGENNEQNIKYLNAIKVSSDHLLNTVDDLLDFSKLEAGKLRLIKEPFLLKKAIEEVIFSFSLQANKKNIYLRTSGDVEESLSLSGDAHRFKQILYNLIGNAIKFTDDGGVELAVRMLPIGQDRVMASFAVKDTGAGISPKQLDFIFEEFTQVYNDNIKGYSRAIQGTGLGLPICKMLVELQEGTIGVKSTVKKGSVFSFQIPYSIAKVPPPQKVETQIAPPKPILKKSTARNILVVEDDEFNIMLLSILLKRTKYPFDIAADGDTALNLFRTGNYGLVITDINVPKLTGLELAELIRKDDDTLKAATPIIALTADIVGNEFDLYYKEGISRIITKPFKEETLRNLVEEYLSVE